MTRKPKTSRVPPAGKEARLELLLTVADKARWQAAADRGGVKVAALVREAMDKHLTCDDEAARLVSLGLGILALARAHEAES